MQVLSFVQCKLNFIYMNAFAGFMDLNLCEHSIPVYYTT